MSCVVDGVVSVSRLPGQSVVCAILDLDLRNNRLRNGRVAGDPGEAVVATAVTVGRSDEGRNRAVGGVVGRVVGVGWLPGESVVAVGGGSDDGRAGGEGGDRGA